MEPVNLCRWKMDDPSGNHTHFYTCARPGRSLGQYESVPDHIISNWVEGLPKPDTVIISLLGRKAGKNPVSECSYYSFYGPCDTPEERSDKPSFQEWLDHNHKDLSIVVREHPTYDYLAPDAIPPDTIRPIAQDLRQFTKEGCKVVVMDSGGAGRTGHVATLLDARPVPPNGKHC